jgi:hypothetical protein
MPLALIPGKEVLQLGKVVLETAKAGGLKTLPVPLPQPLPQKLETRTKVKVVTDDDLKYVLTLKAAEEEIEKLCNDATATLRFLGEQALENIWNALQAKPAENFMEEWAKELVRRLKERILPQTAPRGRVEYTYWKRQI